MGQAEKLELDITFEYLQILLNLHLRELVSNPAKSHSLKIVLISP